jgi:hypothetical protein
MAIVTHETAQPEVVEVPVEDPTPVEVTEEVVEEPTNEG